MVRNKYGLSRSIPADVKREIRKRCGFGCVICGLGFYEYEHFNPDFADAMEHNPKGMTLLCSQCNQKRARGRLSVQTVTKANANPKCLEQGFANEMFDFHDEPININLSGVNFYDCMNLIVVNGRSMLSIQPPTETNTPLLLSGVFCDSFGNETLCINENEWSVSTDNWDVKCEGPKIRINRGPSDIALVLKMNSPIGVSIERIDMLFEGVRFRGGSDNLNLSLDGRSWSKWRGFDISHCHSAIVINS
ncbi:hypothetical protein SB5439_01063 [Klebsiella variicola]|uniref:hypothetical protein n=1 Tax=Klebsiella variicola TaxID=244366 RepID=UPI00109CA84A|nr:hypothetical protein [Klebsiella variicola]VGP72872.1 hypothetical protein SB5439_01063 [Klebsiella variicola]